MEAVSVVTAPGQEPVFDAACGFSSSIAECTAGYLAPARNPLNASVWMNVTVPAQLAAAGYTGIMRLPGAAALSSDYLASSPMSCPPGMYCPANLPCAIPCAEGFLCVPTVLNNNSRCDPGNVPPLPGTGGANLCPGSSWPVKCPAGSYCPDTVTRLQCPGGKLCMAGSVSPRNCP